MKTNMFELRDAVQQAFNDYTAARMERCWATLYGTFRGILDDLGGNHYDQHSDARKKARAGTVDDQTVDLDIYKAAVAERDRLYELAEAKSDEMYLCHPDDRIGVDGVEIEDGSDSEAEDAEADAAAAAAAAPGVEELPEEAPAAPPRRSKRARV